MLETTIGEIPVDAARFGRARDQAKLSETWRLRGCLPHEFWQHRLPYARLWLERKHTARGADRSGRGAAIRTDQRGSDVVAASRFIRTLETLAAGRGPCAARSVVGLKHPPKDPSKEPTTRAVVGRMHSRKSLCPSISEPRTIWPLQRVLEHTHGDPTSPARLDGSHREVPKKSRIRQTARTGCLRPTPTRLSTPEGLKALLEHPRWAFIEARWQGQVDGPLRHSRKTSTTTVPCAPRTKVK